jgi:hypothetical protein
MSRTRQKNKLFADAFGIVHKSRRDSNKDYEYTRPPGLSAPKTVSTSLSQNASGSTVTTERPKTAWNIPVSQPPSDASSTTPPHTSTVSLSASASSYTPAEKKESSKQESSSPDYGDFSFIPNIAWRAVEEAVWKYFSENTEVTEYIMKKPQITLDDFKVPAEDWKFNGTVFEKKVYSDLSDIEKNIRRTYGIHSTSVSCSIRAIRFILTNEDGWEKYYNYSIMNNN